jgi:hypothetical protein
MWGISANAEITGNIASFGFSQPYSPGHEFSRALSALQERCKSIGVGASNFSIFKHDKIDFESHLHYLWERVHCPACFAPK